MVTAKQGRQVEYFFRPVSYTPDGRRSHSGAPASVRRDPRTRAHRRRRRPLGERL